MTTALRVLVVEDSPDDYELVLIELQQAGIQVHSRRVETREDFEQALQAEGWDVILSDFTMPLFSALEALERLQRSRLDIPFIIVSGSVGEDIAVAAMKAGAHDFFSKDR